MERMYNDDQIRARRGAVGLPAHVIASMKRASSEPSSGLVLDDGREVSAHDPFWGRYDAFLQEKATARGVRQATSPVRTLGAAPLPADAHCRPTFTYSEDDGKCHAPAGYSGNTPAVIPPSCDNGGVYDKNQGACVMYAGMTAPDGTDGDTGGGGISGGSPDTATSSTTVATMAKVALAGVAVVGLAYGGYYVYRNRSKR